MWGTCTAGQGFSSGEGLQHCAKEMKGKFVEISEFWRILTIELRSFVSDKKAGKISVHLLFLCQQNFVNKVMNRNKILRHDEISCWLEEILCR